MVRGNDEAGLITLDVCFVAAVAVGLFAATVDLLQDEAVLRNVRFFDSLEIEAVQSRFAGALVALADEAIPTQVDLKGRLLVVSEHPTAALLLAVETVCVHLLQVSTLG